MKRFLTLLKVNIKLAFARSGQSLGTKGKNKIWFKLFTGVLYLALMALFFNMGRSFVESLPDSARSGRFYADMILRMSIFIIMFTTVAMIPASLFFADDTRAYIVMPIKATELILVKIISLVVQAYLAAGMISIPMAIGALSVAFAVKELLIWLYLIIIMPLIPVGLITVIYLIILKFVPYLRNQKRLAAISSFMTIVFAMGIGMMSSMVGANSMSLSMASSIKIPSIFNWIMPIFRYGSQCFSSDMQEALPAFLILTAASIIWLQLAVLISDKLYFPILNSMVVEASGKKISRKELMKKSGKTNRPFMCFFNAEIKNILRTPAYLLNGLIGPMMVLLFFVLIIIIGIKEVGFTEVISSSREAFTEFTSDPAMAFKSSIIVAIVMSGVLSMNSIACTTMSRDARQFEFFKSIPVDGKTIIFGKFFGSMAIPMAIAIIPVLLVLLVLPFNPIFHLCFIFMFLISIYTLNLIGLLPDLISPKKDWMNETQAVKQTKSGFLSVLLNYAIMGYFVYVIINKGVFGIDQNILLAIGLGLFLLISFSISFYVIKRGNKIIRNI